MAVGVVGILAIFVRLYIRFVWWTNQPRDKVSSHEQKAKHSTDPNAGNDDLSAPPMKFHISDGTMRKIDERERLREALKRYDIPGDLLDTLGKLDADIKAGIQRASPNASLEKDSSDSLLLERPPVHPRLTDKPSPNIPIPPRLRKDVSLNRAVEEVALLRREYTIAKVKLVEKIRRKSPGPVKQLSNVSEGSQETSDSAKGPSADPPP